LQRDDHALLLENALFDTTRPVPSIPDHLRAHGDPGSYLVQARGPIDNAFRSLLQAAGAEIISYIPNNAYLVRASAAVAQQLSADPQTQAILPYEPYYKLKLSLLKLAVAQDPLPGNSMLNVLLFADAGQGTRADLEKLGARIMGDEEPSPFGPVLKVRPPTDGLAAIAGLPGVQEVEWALTRASANDLSRGRIGVAADSVATNSYLGLSGSNVLVNINDSEVDATHPDLIGRVIGDGAMLTPVLNNGHGTHVAGIIASSGGQSATVTNVSGPDGLYAGTNGNQFRGMAPAARLFVLPVGMFTKPFTDGGTLSWPSDAFLQQAAARTNAFISNNSWNYVGNDSQTYDLHAASYDAAVRDALPTVPGSQPLLLVFSAGNSGGGNSEGSGGNADTINSPGTAKNVITVGAIEQVRKITNLVWKCSTPGSTNNCKTNQPWMSMTDASDQVASFSSRGPVGVGIEGDSGRFKPDLVAPGTFVLSTRSQQWDTNAYYNPTGHIIFVYRDVLIPTNDLYYDSIFVPANAVQLNLTLVANTNSPVPFPPLAGLPIWINSLDFPTNTDPVIGTNSVSLPPDLALSPIGAYWYYGIGNRTNQPVVCDLWTDIVVTNDLGNYLQVLEELNDSLGGYYRYESGTSMAAADASGTLALMQEFFLQRLGRTNSPALMKALLINGARSVGNLYDYNVTSPVVSQGWGVINLPATLPGALTNSATANPMVMADQSPASALATSQSRTYKVALSPDAQSQPLRVTLVWTDPPGNPVASVKLVNDLDLVVTNLDYPSLVYFGNDITTGNDFNQAWSTNAAPNLDRVNNVENVFLSPTLGINSKLSTNYSITVVGRRVNVNAVTAQTNNVCQDYALVISSGDGLVTNAITTFTTSAIVSSSQPLVTVITNSFDKSPGLTGGVLFDQRVGANPQLLGTNTILDSTLADAVITLGVTNQWHFYIITNDTLYTNAAFLTFLPANLAVPRMGVFQPSADRATRPEADIDLYVAPPTIPNNYALTNLDPAVVEAATKSLSRGGTETIVYSNAMHGVYYLGVKSEDQQAGEYALMGVFSEMPFGQDDEAGSHLVGIPVYQLIPDGSPQKPGVATIMAIDVSSMLVRRVIVTNIINHELIGDLLGNLSHGADYAILNNHTCITDPTTTACQTWTSYVYDDSSEYNVGPNPSLINPHVGHTDGPGSLSSFAGQDGVGQWMLTMVDNATNHVGTNVSLEVFLERQPPLTGNGVVATIQGGACRDDFIEVPANATSLSITVAVVSASAAVNLSIDLCPLAGGACASTVVTNTIGGSVTIDQTDLPPLQVGTYKVHICNLLATPITVRIRAVFTFSQNTLMPVLSAATTNPVPILDDAVTEIFLTNNLHAIISSLDVGLLLKDPRVSDLAITLISPDGTRVLLFENRGAFTTNGLGLGTFGLSVVTNMVAVYTNNFNAAPVGLYAPGATFQGWSVLSNLVDVLDDYTCFCLSNHVLALLDGAVSNSLPTTNAVMAPAMNPYTLTYKVNHLPWLEGMVTWWPLDVDGSDIFGGLNGLLLGDVVFSTGATNLFTDQFDGPSLNPMWQAGLPNAGTGGSATPAVTNMGAPTYTFTTLGTNTVMQLSSTLSAWQRRGWRSATIFNAQDFRYEVRFNTSGKGANTSIGGFLELWILDALNTNRYDMVSPFADTNGTSRALLAGSSIDNAYNSLTFNFQTNTWYRLVLTAPPSQSVRASVLSDSGVELAGVSFGHGASTFSSGFRIVLSQFVGAVATNTLVQAAVDYARLTTGQFGEVNQAFYGDGVATRMVVPRCPELDLGRGRGFSIEGWINPAANHLAGAAYDPQADFSTNSNPNGVWKYAWSTGLTGALTLYPRASQPAVNNGMEVGWDDPTNSDSFTPSVAVNTGGDFSGGPGNVTFKAGALILHPCGSNGTAYSHVIWTAPRSGQFALNSLFYAQQDAINVDVHVLVNRVSLFDSTITANGVSRGFATNFTLSAGDTVDFAVGPNNNLVKHAGNTGLTASVTPLFTAFPPVPLVEWNDSTSASPQGVQFWLSGLAGTNSAPGALVANLWDTNLQSHIIGTVTNAITNGGWQHVALTYNTNSASAILYTNGQPAATVLFPTNFVPRTSGDLYLGYDPGTVVAPISYPNFNSTAGLNLVGSTVQLGSVLRLTPATSGGNIGNAWFRTKQSCVRGFDTTFQFRITNPGGTIGDGISFTVQNAGPTVSGVFANLTTATNFVSVWFNTYKNWPDCFDPTCDISANSVGIVTNGIYNGSPNGIYAAQTDLTPLGINLIDGAVHTSRISFDGAVLNVWLDNLKVLSNVPLSGLANGTDSTGQSWVGFGSFTGGGWENQDILSWTFGSPSAATCFAGGLDEFSLYERALSPCEVNAIYNAGSRGKYGTNVLVCPVATEVTLLTALGSQTYAFTNGLTWTNTGPLWETNTISFTTATNPTAIIVRGLNPYNPTDTNSANNLNAVVDDFVMSAMVTNSIDGLLHFTENTNLAALPIKFAPAPYVATNFPPVLIFTNDFGTALPGLYNAGGTIPGSPNSVAIGPRDWTVTQGPVTVVSNILFDAVATNWLAMATGAVQCLVPTSPGHRYQLSYNLRGPCAVGWWNGTVDPLSQRAQDLISGNNGAFMYGATNTIAPWFDDISRSYVGSTGFYFNGQTEPPPAEDPDIFPEDVDDPSSTIDLADPPQLQFTNAFTIEAWIKPTLPINATYCGTEQIFFRGYPEVFDCAGLGDPYWLALEPSADPNRYDLHFHIAEAHVGTLGADVLTTNSPIQLGGGSNGGWWHIAAVFDKPVTNYTFLVNATNVVTITTNAMRLYLNGVCIASNYTTLSPYQDLDPALSPGVAIGDRSRFDSTQPFSGFMDELTVYARALTGPEIAAIAAARTDGKADLSVAPVMSLAKLSVVVDGTPFGIVYGDNSQWTTHTVEFTALETNAVVILQSLLPGTLVDGVALTEIAPELYYLPETPLTDLYGKDAFGIWTLEIWDNRAGGGATNLAQLLDWELTFGLAPINPPPVITLSHGIPYTNSIAANNVQYFVVPVPQWAALATNILQFADQVRTGNPLPISVLFNQTNYPSPADQALIGPLVSSGTTVLTTNGTPPLVLGQSYYLAVTNPNPVGVTFALGVAFDITTLANCQVATNFAGPAGIPRYFQFDVPTNGQPANLPAEAVSLWLSGARSNLTLVMSEHLPLPDLNHYDYISDQPSTNDEIVMLLTNSTPFPIQTNRWYLGVFNTTATNVVFALQACLNTDLPIIIPLTNGIPFNVSSVASPFAAPPGPPRRVFFDLLIESAVSGVLFELYDLCGDADLVLQPAVLPTMAPYFDGSYAVGLTPEQIVVRRSADVPDLRGHWYLGVYNNEQTNVTYTIRAVLPDDRGFLTSAQPFTMSLTSLNPPHGVLLSWNSVEGESYFVQYTSGLTVPVSWTNIGFVVATTPLTTFEVLPMPVPSELTNYQIIQVSSSQPTLNIQLYSTNQVRLSWPTAYIGYTLQSSPSLFGPWTNAGLAVTVVGNEFVAYDNIGSGPKYYRLFK
jgi:subtilisin-like proprotein convertase family protein